MSDKKGVGSKLLGLFVEQDKGAEAPPAEEAEKSPAEVVAELAGQAPAKGHPGAKPAPPPPLQPVPRPTGNIEPANVDFDVVFKSAGVDPQELDRVKKATDLIKDLPEDIPLASKRKIVESSLRAFGIDAAKIVLAAQNQVKALDTYARLNEQQTAKAIADTKAQIAQLEDKVIGLRADIDKKTQNLAGLGAAADLRKAQVNQVLQFFQAPAPGPAGTPGQ